MTYLELARWLGEDHELHDVLVVMHEAAEVAKDIESARYPSTGE